MTRALSFVAARRAIGLVCGGSEGKALKVDAWTTLEAITVLRGASFASVQGKVRTDPMLYCSTLHVCVIHAHQGDEPLLLQFF
jgi:hypothetical protein